MMVDYNTMPIYIATPLTTSTAACDAAVVAKIPEIDRFRMQGGHGWLIKFEGTSTELTNAIGITVPDKSVPSIGSAIVAPISSYYGLGPTDMWEWLKTRLEK